MKKMSLLVSLLVCLSSAAAAATPAADASPDASARHRGNVEFLNSGRFSDWPFSEAVRVGNLVFFSGELGDVEGNGKIVPGGIVAEARQTMENIKASVEAKGYKMSDVVKCTVFLADISEWAAFNTVYKSYFNKPYPARSAFGANGLALGARVEVECMAAR